MLDVNAHRLTTTRWIGCAPRIALITACLVVTAAGVRALLASPEPPGQGSAPLPTRDIASEAFAEAFTRDFLTWDEGNDRDDPLRRYGPDLEPASPPAGMHQRVAWTTVTGSTRRANTTTVTVLAETTRGRRVVAVRIAHHPDGTRAIVRQPAIVGALPPTRRTPRPPTETPIDDGALAIVARRALTNYLAGDRDDLTADLAPDATVVLPDQRLAVRSVDAITWVLRNNLVAVAARVRDVDGVEMSLRYELTVRRMAGRWLVRAIHTNPEVQ